MNSVGPTQEPWGTPDGTGLVDEQTKQSLTSFLILTMAYLFQRIPRDILEAKCACAQPPGTSIECHPIYVMMKVLRMKKDCSGPIGVDERIQIACTSVMPANRVSDMEAVGNGGPMIEN